MERAFAEVEISQAISWGLDVPVRPARPFPAHCCVGINMMGDARRDLLDPKLRDLEHYQ